MLTTANAVRIPLADGVVHTCTSSPPYFRQRRYGVVCDWPAVSFRPSSHLSEQWHVEPWRGEMGWEPHVLDYIGHLVLVYREVYRVLRDDGQNWLNISDKRTDSREWFRVPEMLVEALAADGWRHEDTVIWHKESAMPGSQQNRFTRDFEYIYRLNKSRTDFFDIDAVREANSEKWKPSEMTWEKRQVLGQYENGEERHHATRDGGQYSMKSPGGLGHNPAGRTRRTVWTINPEGLNLPHYAAYPRELVRVMLKASVSERGVCAVCGKPWGRVVERTNASKTTPVGYRADELKRDEKGGRHGMAETHTTAWRPTCTCAGKPTRGPVRCGRCGGTGRERLYPQATRREGSPYDVGTRTSALYRSGGAYETLVKQGGDGKVETGAPCPHCDGGTTEGNVWPADVDTWPTAPAIVLDPFVGSGTTAVVCQELRQLGTPVTCMGLDLNHHYLADLARERLGLLALEAWEGGKDGGNGRGLEGLPLFRELATMPG